MNAVSVNSFERAADYCAALLTRPLVGFLCVVVFTLIPVLGGTEADPDLFARIAVGKLFFNSGFQLADPFSFSPLKEIWVDHEWLAGVVFYHTSQLGGDSALLLLKCVFILATLFFLYEAASMVSNRWLALLTCSFAGIESSYLWSTTIRSQVFTYFFIAYILWAIAMFLTRSRLWQCIPIPFCLLVWSQAHGGFVVGLGFCCLFAAWLCVFYPRLRLIAVCLAGSSMVATLISPYGPVIYWAYILEAVTMKRPSISEWAPVDPFSVFGFALHLLTFICLIGLLRKNKSHVDILVGTLLLVSCYQAYSHQRLAGIFCFVAATLGTPYIVQAWAVFFTAARQRILQRAAAVAILIIAPLCLLLVSVTILRFSHLSYDEYPVQAMDWLQQNNATGTLLVDFNNGSFAIWRGYPQLLISLDGRYEELYPDSTLALVTAALQPDSANHTEALTFLDPDYILLDMRAYQNPPRFPAAWQEVYRDATFTLLAQNAPSVSLPPRPADVIVADMWKRDVLFPPRL